MGNTLPYGRLSFTSALDGTLPRAVGGRTIFLSLSLSMCVCVCVSYSSRSVSLFLHSKLKQTRIQKNSNAAIMLYVALDWAR